MGIGTEQTRHPMVLPSSSWGRARERRRPQVGGESQAGIAIGVVLLCVSVLLTFRAMERTESPFEIRVEVDAVLPAAGGFHVAFTAHNLGRRTAQRVRVIGEIADRGMSETAQSSLGYIAAGSELHGGLFLHHDPRVTRLSLRAVSDNAP